MTSLLNLNFKETLLYYAYEITSAVWYQNLHSSDTLIWYVLLLICLLTLIVMSSAFSVSYPQRVSILFDVLNNYYGVMNTFVLLTYLFYNLTVLQRVLCS